MTSVPNILVVAEAATSGPLCAYLADFQMQAFAAADTARVATQLEARRIDLVVLDLMLPAVNTLALTRELIGVHQLPVVLLSEHGSAADRVVGLEMGAADCMERPLIRRELVARIRTVLRRTGLAATPPDLVRFDGWELHRRERALRTPDGAPVALSNAEFRLLCSLLSAPGGVVSRDELAAPARPGRRIDLLVSRLRHKLIAQDDAAPLIRTVRGVGYRFEAVAVEGA